MELIRLLCVTDHVLPNEEQHWVAPAYLGRIVSGDARNCEPDKTREVRWFEIGDIPQNLTMTARNAIEAYLRESHVERGLTAAGAKQQPTARELGVRQRNWP